MVFFTGPVAEVPQEVLLFKKAREAGAEQVAGFRAGPCPALPGCVRAARDVVSYSGRGHLLKNLGLDMALDCTQSSSGFGSQIPD